MDSTESFEDNLSSIFNELFGIVSKEKIVGKHSLTLGQIILSFFEVKLHIQALKNIDVNLYKIDLKILLRFKIWKIQIKSKITRG